MFYGLNTFLGLYFMARWHQTADQGSRASVVFLGTSIVGTLLGGWLADRFGRLAVIRTGFAGAAVFLALFLRTSDRTWATGFLIPLSVFMFLPTSVLVVLGQEYLPHRVGMASGVTLGLAVSVGGMTRTASGPMGAAARIWRRLRRALGRALAGDCPGVLTAAGRTRGCILTPNSSDRRFSGSIRIE